METASLKMIGKCCLYIYIFLKKSKRSRYIGYTESEVTTIEVKH